MSEPFDVFSAMQRIADDPSYERVVFRNEVRLRDSLANVERLVAQFGQANALRLVPHVLACNTRVCHRLTAGERVYIAPDPWTAHVMCNDVLLNLDEPLVYEGAELLPFPRWQTFSPYMVFGPMHRIEDLLLPSLFLWLQQVACELQTAIAGLAPSFQRAFERFNYDFSALRGQMMVVEHNLLQPTLWLVGLDAEAPREKLDREGILRSIPLFRAGRADVVLDNYYGIVNLMGIWDIERAANELQNFFVRFSNDHLSLSMKESYYKTGLLPTDDLGWGDERAAYVEEELERARREGRIVDELPIELEGLLVSAEVQELLSALHERAERPEPFVQEYGVLARGMSVVDIQEMFVPSSSSDDEEGDGGVGVAGVI